MHWAMEDLPEQSETNVCFINHSICFTVSKGFLSARGNIDQDLANDSYNLGAVSRDDVLVNLVLATVLE